jgi:hypothetical protein
VCFCGATYEQVAPYPSAESNHGKLHALHYVKLMVTFGFGRVGIVIAQCRTRKYGNTL